MSCPNCGYCPACGRGGYRTYPYQVPFYTYIGDGPFKGGETASPNFQTTGITNGDTLTLQDAFQQGKQAQ